MDKHNGYCYIQGALVVTVQVVQNMKMMELKIAGYMKKVDWVVIGIGHLLHLMLDLDYLLQELLCLRLYYVCAVFVGSNASIIVRRSVKRNGDIE